MISQYLGREFSSSVKLRYFFSYIKKLHYASLPVHKIKGDHSWLGSVNEEKKGVKSFLFCADLKYFMLCAYVCVCVYAMPKLF